MIVIIFLLIEKDKIFKAFIFLFLILFFKENQAIVWVSVGFYYIFFKKRHLLGLIILILGIIFGLLIQLTLIPYFNPNNISNHAGRFGPLENIDDKIYFIYEGFKNLSFLPLISPNLLPTYLSSYSLTLVANNLYTWNFHYQGLPLIITFVLLNHAIKKITEIQLSYYLKYSLILFFLIFYLNKNNSLFLHNVYKILPSQRELSLHKEIIKFKKSFANNENVIYVDERLGPHFASFNIRSLDQWSGYKRIINEKEPHYVLMAKKPISEIPEEKYLKFLKYFNDQKGKYTLEPNFDNLYFFKHVN